MGFVGAFRRSELLALEVAIPRGTRLRLVETLQAWLAAAAITEGPLFRPVSKGGTVRPVTVGDYGFVRSGSILGRATN